MKDKSTGEPVIILSVLEKPLKFLVSEVTGNNTPAAMFDFLCSKLTTKLESMDKSTLRGKYKLNIYTRFALPSIRFYFSVHHIHKSHMINLDNIAKRFIKKWLGIQTNGVSDKSIFHPNMLDVKMPSQLYLETYAGTYSTIRLKGDRIVNHDLDSRLERETNWKRKFSTIKPVNDIFQENVSCGWITIPELPDMTTTKIAIQRAKKVTKASIQAQTLTLWNDRVKK